MSVVQFKIDDVDVSNGHLVREWVEGEPYFPTFYSVLTVQM